jgi:hypothetical protein
MVEIQLMTLTQANVKFVHTYFVVILHREVANQPKSLPTFMKADFCDEALTHTQLMLELFVSHSRDESLL